MSLPATLRTPRLRLRPPTLADAPWIFDRYAADAEVTRYLQWRPHHSEASVRAFLDTLVEPDDGTRAWVIEAGGDGVGMIGAHVRGVHHYELGYVLARPAWGNGWMTEAVRAVGDAALKLPMICRVSAYVDVDNLASQRVLLKAGFQHEGVLRRYAFHPNVSSGPRDCAMFSRVA